MPRKRKVKVSGPKYRAAPGATFSHEEADIIGRHLEVLEEEAKAEGLPLTTERMLKDARQESSPLHPLITWNVKEAALKCQLSEIRRITNHIIKLRYEDDGSMTQVKAFPSIRLVYADQTLSVRGYASMATIETSEYLMAQVIEDAWRELEYWRARYEQYKTLFPMTRAVAEILAEMRPAARRTSAQRAASA